MGDSSGDNNQKPAHYVTLGDFYISDHEVTVAEYKECVDSSGDCTYDSSVNDNSTYGQAGKENHPINYIDQEKAKEFISWVNSKSTRTFRLCSEAEWEYATRAGTTTTYSCNDASCLDDVAWHSSNSGETTHEIKTKQPNAWGLYDMQGNLWEHVQDSYYSNYDNAPTNGSSWDGPVDESNVIRGGGAFWTSADEMRSALRMRGFCEMEGEICGFRLCRSPLDSTSPTITSISPVNGGSSELYGSISVSFSEEMDVSTIDTNIENMACDKAIQISSDDFQTCVQMSAVTADSNKQVFTVTPASDLIEGTNYKIKVTVNVKDVAQNEIPGDAVTPDGFTARNTPLVTNISPIEGTTASSYSDTEIIVEFDDIMNVATIDTNNDNTDCDKAIQISSDDFQTCIQMLDVSPDVTEKIFSVKPASEVPANTYKIKVTSSPFNTIGNGLLSDYITTIGFTTYEIKLPDTGLTACYDITGDVIACPAPGNPAAQDGSYPRNPQSFNDNGDETITDNSTKLVWQKRTDLYDSSDTCRLDLRWYSANSHCNNLSFAGNDDWRLPSIKELRTLVDNSKSSPAVNEEYFPQASTNLDYWSSTTSSHYSNMKWYLDINEGIESRGNAGDQCNRYPLCVRGGNETDIWSLDFVDIDTAVVSHRSTRLMWQKEDDNVERSWGSALSYCQNLNIGGYEDWRLPNVVELQSIKDYSIDSLLDQTYFPNTNSSYYWTSTYRKSGGAAWRISFENDAASNASVNYIAPSTLHYARCARGGQ